MGNTNNNVPAMTTITAGTLLYHGTDCDDLDEENDPLQGPAWLSSSKDVADYFAKRHGGWGGKRRIITYRLFEDVRLYEILSQADMQMLADEFQISLCGVEEMRESVDDSGIPGWVIPNNYPSGDDILLSDVSVLEYVKSEFC